MNGYFAVSLLLASLMAESPAVIQVDSVLVTLIDQVEVTAMESGILAEVLVKEGELVKDSDVLARLDDAEARIAVSRAKVELEIARQQADSDVRVCAAEKTWEVAKAELKRATESVESYKKSVSATELDRLNLTVEQTSLQIEQAKLDRTIAELTADLRKNEYDQANLKVARHRVLAPIDGMVVQVNRKKGEWVQPGDVVIRILRVNRLRAEFFLNASQLEVDLSGRPAHLTVDLPGRPKARFPGRIVFVSPEINAVNDQVRVWAEIDNSDLVLRPGLKGSLTIEKGNDQ